MRENEGRFTKQIFFFSFEAQLRKILAFAPAAIILIIMHVRSHHQGAVNTVGSI